MEFTEVYNQYRDKIYRVCLGFVNDSENAKDLTQETFIAVLQNLNSFRQEANIGTWIYRIATNKCLQSIAHEKNVKSMELPIEVAHPTNEREDRKLNFLRKSVTQLPEIDRIIITLFMEDIPQDKIAEITGLSHANVRVKVHRIKERLLKKFNENGQF